MSTRTNQRTPTPTLPTKDPPRIGRVNQDKVQGRNVNWQSYASVAARNLVSPSKVAESQREQEEREGTPNSTESSSWAPQESHYRPIKRGSTEHSVFFDVTNSVTSPKLFYKALSDILTEDQHLGAKFYKENGRSLIEIACDSESTCDSLIASGVVVQHTKLVPTKAFAQDADIVTLKLSDLPFVRKLDLQKNLHEILGKYGEVLDVLLFTDPDSGFFFGNGMAILNRTIPQKVLTAADYNPDVPYYALLTHNLDYYGKKRFHAKWRNMPPHCIYCHSEDHVVADCDERPKIRCWTCSAFGHVSAKCPQKNVMKTRKKPKHKPSTEEFSENEDEDFERNLTNLGEEAEQEYKSRLDEGEQNLSNQQGSTGAKNTETENPKDTDDLSLSTLSDVEEDEHMQLEQQEDEDVDMIDESTDTNQVIREGQETSTETLEEPENGNQGQHTSISTPIVGTGAAPRTPKPLPQKTANVLSLRNRDVTKSGGSKGHRKPQNKQ